MSSGISQASIRNKFGCDVQPSVRMRSPNYGCDVWGAVAAVAIAWVIIAYAFRYSSLAALVAAIFAPLYYGMLFGVDAILLAVIAMSALLVWRHSGNIGNLIAGKESKLGSKSGGAKK